MLLSLTLFIACYLFTKLTTYILKPYTCFYVYVYTYTYTTLNPNPLMHIITKYAWIDEIVTKLPYYYY
jgi:hypothetical protein